jgi:hypothetical protein
VRRIFPHPLDFLPSVLVLIVFAVSAMAQHVGYYSKVLTEGQPGAIEIGASRLLLGAGSNLVVLELDSVGGPHDRVWLDMHAMS